MIYKLDTDFSKIEQEDGLMQNLSHQAYVEVVSCVEDPRKDSGIILLPLEKINFKAKKGESVFARSAHIGGTPANISVVNFNVPASGGSGAGYNIGDVFFTAKSSAPEGSLKADGSEISRDEYSDLFEAVGTVFGEGDGATTFNLPDLRGEFIRGLDDGRGADVNRVIGSAQSDTLKEHNHYFFETDLNPTENGDSTATDIPCCMDTGGMHTATNKHRFVSNTGDAETRPRNIALLACIQYQ